MSLVVFPFKSENLEVIEANLAAAAGHSDVKEVWAVAAEDGPVMDSVAVVAGDVTDDLGCPVKVFPQERLGSLRPGKGDGMNTALRAAAERGFDRLHFYDADITNFDHTWIGGAESVADRGYDIVRHRFPRAATDAMITWMITRPSLAKLFPGTLLPRLGQPLGGELLLSRRAVERLAADEFVVARSDWGVDTVLTYATAVSGLPMYEHNIADGKRHALYGSLDEIRTMVVECLDAAASLRSKPRSAGVFDTDPPAPVPTDLKETVGFDLQRTIPLLTAGWSSEEEALAGSLPEIADPVLANRETAVYEFMDASTWGRTLGHLLEYFRLGDPAWESLAFRLWLMRVLAYVTTQVDRGYDRAIEYLETTIAEYETGS